MDLAGLKEKIILKIEETDDIELLLQIQDIIANYHSFVKEPTMQYGIENDQDIVAYTVDGKPLTKAEYVAEIELAAKEIEEGKGIPHEQVKAEMQKWIENRLSGTL